MPIPTRITSENIVIKWLPLAESAGTHAMNLTFDSAVDGGTFKLWVNGEETAAITVNEATPGTTATNIQAALDNTDVLAASELTVGGTYPNLTITAAAAGFYHVQIVEGAETTLTQTTANNNKKLQTEVTTQGSEWFTLSAHASSFSFEESTDMVDVSAFADRQTIELPTRSSMSFDISMFRADEEWLHSIFAGAWGLLEVYPEGVYIGKDYMRFRALIGSVSEDFPNAEAVEKSISGSRQGNWHVYPNTVYKG